jgi:7,8-dihydroneopterin aldolase/epimerase/oxygenase
MDRILMEGMAFFGRHGVHPAERETGVHFTVDVALELDASGAASSDDLGDTVDYGEAYDLVREVLEGDPCHLVETLAARVADRLLAITRVERVTVTVRKRPPLPGGFRSFGVEVVRSR